MTSKVDVVESVGVGGEQEVKRFSKSWTIYIDSLMRDNPDLVRTTLSATLERVYCRVLEDVDGQQSVTFRAEIREEATNLIQAEFERIQEARIESMGVH